MTVGEQADTAERWVSRKYHDALGEIEVVRSTSNADADSLLQGYVYDGKPLIESWPRESDATPYQNHVTEMRVASFTFARMGSRAVTMTPRTPPDPDLFVDSYDTGPLAVEITLDKDFGEARFQNAMHQFLTYLNEHVAGLAVDFPVDVNLGFVSVPAARDHERIAKAIVANVRENASIAGTHHFTDELASLFAQYDVSARTDASPFSGGAVVNDRGLPDIYASVMVRIEDKRDGATYTCAGRSTWLVVGMSPQPLFSPDVMRALYETDIGLGQFDCIVAERLRKLCQVPANVRLACRRDVIPRRSFATCSRRCTPQ